MTDLLTKLGGLSPEKRKLLELRLKEAQARKAQAPGPRARAAGEPAPLSFPQQRLWFLDRLSPGTAAYNIPAPIRLRGPLRPAVVERALDALRERHESLRTTFAVRDDEPVQVVHPLVPVPLPVDDLSALSAAARETEVRRIVDGDAHTGFDLERGPLFRARLVRLGDEEHVLALNFHHSISDAWSLGVFSRELERLYDAFLRGEPSPLEPLPLQYADFAHWQREHLSPATVERHLSFWRRVLEGAPPALELPEFRPRPATPSGHG
ncbi:MAG TPA: condensation domain-containing protein, partial [Longimicrobium sp.]|nr:condensation domain-containing protein [Longimicrobium sp.]